MTSRPSSVNWSDALKRVFSVSEAESVRRFTSKLPEQPWASYVPVDPVRSAETARVLERLWREEEPPHVHDSRKESTKREYLRNVSTRTRKRLRENWTPITKRQPCPYPVTPVYRGTDGSERYVRGPCDRPRCRACREYRLDVSAERVSWAFEGHGMYRHCVAEDDWPAMRKRASRKNAAYAQFPVSGQRREVLATRPLGDDAVLVPSSKREAVLAEINASRPVDDRRQFGGSQGFLPPDPRAGNKGKTGLEGYWSRRKVVELDQPSEALVQMAEPVGLQARALDPGPRRFGGVQIDSHEGDPRLREFRRLVGFVQLQSVRPVGHDGVQKPGGDERNAS